MWISGENFIPLRIFYSVKTLRLETLARGNQSHSATGLCEDKDFPPRDIEFSSLILIFLMSRVLFGGGMPEQEWLQTLWISFRWVHVQSVSSGICAWLRCPRSSQESPTRIGLGSWDPAWGAAGAGMPAGMQLCWIWLLLLSPASDRALSNCPRLRQKGLSPSAGGAGEKGSQPAAVKMSFVWVQKASTG